MRTSISRTTALLVLGPALLAGCTTTAPPAGSASDAVVGTSPGAVPDGAGPVPVAAPTTGPTVTSPVGPVPDVPVRDAGLGAGATASPSPPVRVVYEGIGIDLPVLPVGVADDGQMEIPADALEAGWYRFGPSVGQDSGTAVVAAHAGSYVTPFGPFFHLRDAEVGDRVVATRADGLEVTYQVSAVERVDKGVIDLGAYFRRSGDPRLVLFTCGGRWDDARQSYDDNVVVTATLVDG